MGAYPSEDGEEREGDGGSGGVSALPQRVVLLVGCLPLIGQEAEANEPHEGPEGCKQEVTWPVSRKCHKYANDQRGLPPEEAAVKIERKHEGLKAPPPKKCFHLQVDCHKAALTFWRITQILVSRLPGVFAA